MVLFASFIRIIEGSHKNVITKNSIIHKQNNITKTKSTYTAGVSKFVYKAKSIGITSNQSTKISLENKYHLLVFISISIVCSFRVVYVFFKFHIFIIELIRDF